MFTQKFRCAICCVAQHGTKLISTTFPNAYKVTVCGASGGIGLPLCLLLKKHPLVTHLSVYDVSPVTLGVAVDLSHMNTPSKVSGYRGTDQLTYALKDADIVMVPAGIPVKPGMTRDDVFEINASIICELMNGVAQACPNALIGIITNPVNSTVPVAAEVLKKAGAYNSKKLFGVTTLDVVRACTFVAEMVCCDPRDVNVPVIGGHSEGTIIPVLSQCTPELKGVDPAGMKGLIQRVKDAGLDVVKIKAGQGSATLSMAYSTTRFISSLLDAMQGRRDVVECAYVESSITEAKYFATPLLLNENGIEKNLGLGELNEYECQLLQAALPEIIRNIQKGEDFISKLGYS